MSKTDDRQVPKPDLLRRERSAEDKLRLVLEASPLSDAEIGEFLRREGLHEAEVHEWRDAMIMSTPRSRPSSLRSG